MPLADFCLTTLINDKFFIKNIPRIKDLLNQTLSGLTHLAKFGISHLDIKPGNILVKNEYNLFHKLFNYFFHCNICWLISEPRKRLNWRGLIYP